MSVVVAINVLPADEFLFVVCIFSLDVVLSHKTSHSLDDFCLGGNIRASVLPIFSHVM